MMKRVKRAQVVLGLVWESVQFAISSLRSNKLRTLLSLLGITIGIFTIVLVLAVIGGLKGNIRSGLDSLGSNTITVQRESWELEGEWNWWEFAKRPTIEIDDYNYLKRYSETSESITFFSISSGDFSYLREKFTDGNIVSVSTDFEKIFAIGVDQGRWFLPNEQEGRGNLCFVGSGVASALFKGESGVGKRIKVGNFNGEVIGVASPQGESIATIFDIDNSIFVPVGFGEAISGAGGGGAVAIAPKDGTGQQEAIDEIRYLVRRKRGLTPSDEDNFAINRMSYLASAVDEVFRTINLVGWLIGGFALLIGAFGIANILFVSVKERMPQIGIQKALGAGNYMILAQFLSEAAVLSLVGGALGILIVVIISLILGNDSPIPFDLTLLNVVEGLSIALVVGILSGVIPAWSAARMDPVRAMNM